MKGRSLVKFATPTYAVLGLGRFGSAVGRELMFDDATVVGIDLEEAAVKRNNGLLSKVVQADCTDVATIDELGISEFDGVVVAIGGAHVEASILTCSLLVDVGVENLWAKSSGNAHGRILDQIGVPHAVHPEEAMGRRVAHLVRGANLDYVELSSGTAIVHTVVPTHVAGPLDEQALWQSHGVKVIAVRREDRWQPVLGHMVLVAGEQVQIYGDSRRVEKLSRMAARRR